MHYLTIIGIITIMIGTGLTYLGQQINNSKDKEELLLTITEKNVEISSLTKEVQLLRENDEQIKEKRDEKIKTVASRAKKIFSEVNMFYAMFFSQNGSDVFAKLMENDFTKHELPDEEIVQSVKKVFMASTMLEASTFALNGNKKPYSNLEYFYIQLLKIHSESNAILQHYGDIDHIIVKQLDEIRGRSEQLLRMIPSLKHVQGGVSAVFGKGVPEQWAGFFTYLYLVCHKCEVESDKILNNDN